MKVLFLMRDDGFMTEPMNIMELSSLAKEGHPERSTHIAVIERDDIVTIAKELSPQVIASSAITGSHRQYLDALKQVKEAVPEAFAILGGPYCSTFPEAINQNPFLDAIGVMECDEAWPLLLDAIESGGDVNELPNIITHENAEIRLIKDVITGQTMVRPDSYKARFSDLDGLPFLDRSLIYDNTAFFHRPKRTHMAGRGCPFRCQYCFEQDWNKMFEGKGRLLQRYSVDRFIDELEWVGQHYDTRFWKFYDDVFPTFPSDISWLEDFSVKYRERIGLPFHCLTRADLVVKKPEVLDLLKDAGAASITMSIESGNAFIRDHIITRDMDDQEIRQAFVMCEEKGITTFANTILGIPAPLLPDVHDPAFNEKLQIIEDDTKYFNPSSRSRKDRLEDLWEAIRSTNDGIERGDYDLEQGRSSIREMLTAISIKKEQLDYDRECVKYNIDLKVSMGEFLMLYPYPRTGTGAYAVKKGWFDGDYDKLHHSYQNRSPLSCFTDHEKAIQQNLALLAPLVILFSGSRRRWLGKFTKPVSWLLLDVFSKFTWPVFTKIYQYMYTLGKTYIYHERIYPMQRSKGERLKDLMEAFHLDIFKQFQKQKIADTHRPGPQLRGSRPGQTLGGPPSV